MDLFRTLAADGSRSLQAALLATKSLRFNLLRREHRMTDLIKALRERREELRNELQENPSFQEYELVCRLLERRETSVSIPSSLPPKASQRKPAPQRKPALQQQPVDRPAPFTRTDRGMNAVIEASADYLRRKGARAVRPKSRRSWSGRASSKTVRAIGRGSPRTSAAPRLRSTTSVARGTG